MRQGLVWRKQLNIPRLESGIGGKGGQGDPKVPRALVRKVICLQTLLFSCLFQVGYLGLIQTSLSLEGNFGSHLGLCGFPLGGEPYLAAFKVRRWGGDIR